MRNALTRRFLLPASTIYATDRCEAYRAGSGSAAHGDGAGAGHTVVLLDEPTSFMDAAACFDMMRLVRRGARA